MRFLPLSLSSRLSFPRKRESNAESAPLLHSDGIYRITYQTLNSLIFEDHGEVSPMVVEIVSVDVVVSVNGKVALIADQR